MLRLLKMTEKIYILNKYWAIHLIIEHIFWAYKISLDNVCQLFISRITLLEKQLRYPLDFMVFWKYCNVETIPKSSANDMPKRMTPRKTSRTTSQTSGSESFNKSQVKPQSKPHIGWITYTTFKSVQCARSESLGPSTSSFHIGPFPADVRSFQHFICILFLKG